MLRKLIKLEFETAISWLLGLCSLHTTFVLNSFSNHMFILYQELCRNVISYWLIVITWFTSNMVNLFHILSQPINFQKWKIKISHPTGSTGYLFLNSRNSRMRKIPNFGRVCAEKVIRGTEGGKVCWLSSAKLRVRHSSHDFSFPRYTVEQVSIFIVNSGSIHKFKKC